MRFTLGILLLLVLAPTAQAQELVQDTVETLRARVVEVVSEEQRPVVGTDTLAMYQTIRAELLEGPREGDSITVDNDYLALRAGETFYLIHTIDAVTGREYYTVSEPYRLPALAWLVGIFLVALAVFGGKQGLRGLVALIASFFCIVYLLLPGILAGYSPVLMALGVSSLIVIAGSYITHGFNRTTSAAVIGMLITIGLTGLLAYFSIDGTRLSGFSSDEATYLNINTRGAIDFVGLLLGGLLIGLLGVLYDAAISQAVAVEELAYAAKHLSKRQLFARGLRIGREHIGALVNTLAIAYAGAALPLLLLLTQLSNNLSRTINQEIFATELVRILVGSIGVILAVPITTAVAVYMLYGRATPPGVERHTHTHSHTK